MDNLRFLRDVENWIGFKIEFAINENYPDASAESVWRKRKYMAGVAGAPCTTELKKRARQQWEERNPVEYHVLGFTADEIDRHKRFTLTERANVLPVLIDAGLTKKHCLGILRDAGIEPPRSYALGFPNANCIGCVKANSVNYWTMVREHYPDVFQRRAELSREIGCKLIKYAGKRYYLDEMPEAAKRSLFSSPECGIFCEER